MQSDTHMNLARFRAVGATLLLTLSCWSDPCAASELEAEDTAVELEEPAPPTAEDLSKPEEPAELEKEPNVDLNEEPSPPIAEDVSVAEGRVELDRQVDVAPAPRRIWYGWQNLAVDGAGQTLALVLGAAIGNGVGLGTGLVSYALGGPIVHFSHGNVGKGFGSLGLRVALPWAGAFAGYAIDVNHCTPGNFCGLAGIVLGFVIGGASAIAIDAAALAYKKVPPQDTSKRSARLESLVVLPTLSPDGGGLSVYGSF